MRKERQQEDTLLSEMLEMTWTEKDTIWQRNWLHEKFAELRKAFGGVCNNPECKNTTDLEFAHRKGKPTKLNGGGRGKKKR